MTASDPSKGPRPSLIERRVRRIINARSVTIGLAVTFVGSAVVGAVVIRIADAHDFPSLGLAMWWALQTVTTVGYGDVVPTTNAGRVVGGVEMVLGIAFIAFVTAGVTSAVIRSEEAKAEAGERALRAEETQKIVEALTQTSQAVTELGRRLDRIDPKPSD